MAAGAVWPHCRPSAGMKAAYEADPGLRTDFAPALDDMLTTLTAGALTKATG